MVYVMLAEGFEEIEAVYPIDVLRRCGVVVTTVSVDGEEFVIGSNGITVQADALLENIGVSKADMLIIPGGPGRVNIAKNENAMRLIKDFAACDVPIAAICGSAEILDLAGILTHLGEERKYTCYPGLEKGIGTGEFVDAQVVVDGDIITAQAAGSSESFAFTIAEKLVGKEKADEVRARMYCKPYCK
jgi:4-methyl-5(b-hydroxyethyl)-thiazole monophosphate biosynthesis